MTPINTHSLRCAFKLFETDSEGKLHIGSALSALHFGLFDDARLQDPKFPRASEHMSALRWDIGNIALIAERLEWMRDLAIRDPDVRERWRNYASLDVAHLFTEIRSPLDYLAQLLDDLSIQPGTLPHSFEKLIGGREKHAKSIQFLGDILDRDFAWFLSLRDMRTKILHQGREPIVFCRPEDGILFQVHGPQLKGLISIPEFMHNDHVVRFEPYMAYHFAEFLILLNDVAQKAVTHLGFDRHLGRARTYGSGFDVVRRWIEQLIAQTGSLSEKS